jgi:GH43 family beta-xylosidase
MPLTFRVSSVTLGCNAPAARGSRAAAANFQPNIFMLKYCHLGLLVCLVNVPLPHRSEAQTQTNAPAETTIRSAVEAPRQFINPIAEGADPWVVRDAKGERYLWCLSEGNRGISLWASPTLTSLGRRHLVWQAPESGPYSKEVWAPELHQLDGHWYIYFAASDGHNHNHLTYVLRSDTEDPLGSYTLHGPLATGDGADGLSPNLWAIDMTVLEHAGRRYAVWSGWDGPRTDRQFLYIAPMRSPTELAGPRVRICANDDYLWERTEERVSSRGLHEGPQVIQRAGRTLLVYSCGASWLRTYKLGLLELVGVNPLDPTAWRKHPQPVFQSSPSTYGVGHSSFVPSPDGTQWWHVFHAKRDPQPGWRRHVFVQPFEFNATGFPQFGTPIDAGVPLSFPSGEPAAAAIKLPYQNSLTGDAAWNNFKVYAHHQYFDVRADGLHLGLVPAHPINEYRCGEKAVLSGAHWTNLTATVNLRFHGGNRDAGLLFRTTFPAMGYDAQRGYFAGILAGAQRAILGKTDGKTWTELASAPIKFDPVATNQLSVTAVGQSLRVSLNGREIIKASDATYEAGAVGLRVVDSHASFQALEVVAPKATTQ